MPRSLSKGRAPARAGVALALALAALVFAGGAEGGTAASPDLDWVTVPARRLARRAETWYLRTPPADRITWGGLGACAVLGASVFLERIARLRRGRIVPRDFSMRFLNRL